MTETRAPSPWRQITEPRVELGRFATTGPLAWTVSRLAGAVTGGGRVHAIDAIGLVPGMAKFYGLYFGYVNSLTSLPRADSELIILRTAWNTGSYYEWFQHVHVSRLAGLSLDEVARVAAGPDAPGWDDKQRAVLSAVDELVTDRLITDPTWAALREFYDNRKLADLCLLTGNYAMLAMLLNTVGAPVEPTAWASRATAWLRRGDNVDAVLDRHAPVLEGSRGLAVPAPPKPPEPTGPDAPNMITRLASAPHWRAGDRGRTIPGALREVGPFTWTLSRIGGYFTRAGKVEAADAIGADPRMMRHYLPFAVKLVLGSHLSRRDTELATLRITWNSGVEYEWYYHAHFSRLSGITTELVERVAQGPSAPGWNERERYLLTAVDELHTDRMISDATWKSLRTFYSERRLAALCLLVGHYDMLAMLFRSFAVTPEPGALRSGPLGLLRPDDDSDPLGAHGAVHLCETVTAPPEVVFDVLTDHRRYADITPLRAVDMERDGHPEPNGIGAIRVIYVLGRRFPAVREQVTEYRAPQRFAYRILSGLPGRIHGTADLTPVPDGTQLDYHHEVHLPFPLPAPLVRLGSRVVIGFLMRGVARESQRRAAE